MNKPTIPKRLAGRIRAAQEKVRDRRQAILTDEFNLRRSEARLNDFSADPISFAARYYRKEVDSYPVQTNINRHKETVGYLREKRPQRLSDLAQAEADLQIFEDQVAIEVSKMRPTVGRVPWPRKLPTFDQNREEWERDCERQHSAWLETWKRDTQDFEEMLQREEQRLEKRHARQDAAYEAQRARWSSAKRKVEDETTERLREMLRSGKISARDLIDYVLAQF